MFSYLCDKYSSHILLYFLSYSPEHYLSKYKIKKKKKKNCNHHLICCQDSTPVGYSRFGRQLRPTNRSRSLSPPGSGRSRSKPPPRKRSRKRTGSSGFQFHQASPYTQNVSAALPSTSVQPLGPPISAYQSTTASGSQACHSFPVAIANNSSIGPSASSAQTIPAQTNSRSTHTLMSLLSNTITNALRAAGMAPQPAVKFSCTVLFSPISPLSTDSARGHTDNNCCARWNTSANSSARRHNNAIVSTRWYTVPSPLTSNCYICSARWPVLTNCSNWWYAVLTAPIQPYICSARWNAIIYCSTRWYAVLPPTTSLYICSARWHAFTYCSTRWYAVRPPPKSLYICSARWHAITYCSTRWYAARPPPNPSISAVPGGTPLPTAVPGGMQYSHPPNPSISAVPGGTPLPTAAPGGKQYFHPPHPSIYAVPGGTPLSNVVPSGTQCSQPPYLMPSAVNSPHQSPTAYAVPGPAAIPGGTQYLPMAGGNQFMQPLSSLPQSAVFASDINTGNNAMGYSMIVDMRPLDAQLDPKIKLKIWQNEYIELNTLIKPLTNEAKTQSLTLDESGNVVTHPTTPKGRIYSIVQ